MTCNFRVGQKVVCVDDAPFSGGWHSRNGIQHGLKLGCVYTVVRVYEQQVYFKGDLVMCWNLSLQELKKPLGPRVGDGFCSARFRPVVERKTDISIFKAILTGKKQEERV